MVAPLPVPLLGLTQCLRFFHLSFPAHICPYSLAWAQQASWVSPPNI